MHLLALDTLVLAGMTFAFAARQDRMLHKQLIPLVAAPAIPLLVLTSSFGLGRAANGFYAGLIFLALLLGPVGIVWAGFLPPRLRCLLFAMHCAIWLPMLWMALHAEVSAAVFWGLGSLFLVVAISFRSSVRRDGAGGFVLVAGFSIWALCFFLHPLLEHHPIASMASTSARPSSQRLTLSVP